MRISKILSEYLIKHQKVSLTGLGVLYLKTPMTLENFEESGAFPPDAIEFVLDYHTPEDETLIAEIALAGNKIHALAKADLDSYIINGKQMMNISKPFIIDRLGILERNYKGEIYLKAIHSNHHSIEKTKKRELVIEEVRFDDNYLMKFKKLGLQYKKGLTLIAGFGFLILFFWFGYIFFRKSSLSEASSESVLAAKPIPMDMGNESKEAEVSAKSDTLSIQAEPFFIIVDKGLKEKAEARYKDLLKWGHNVEMVTSDSINFKLRIPIHATLSDSTFHKDSLARFFGRRVWVEQNGYEKN